MSFDQLFQITYNISLAAVLWATSLRMGLVLSPKELGDSFLRGRMMFKALFVNLVIIPLGVWFLTRNLGIEPGVAIGILLVASAAGGPFGLVASQLAQGDMAYAVALVTVLQLTRLVTIPFWLGIFLPFGPAEIFQIIAALVLYILLPLALGLVLRQFLKAQRGKWARRAMRATVLFLAILVVSGILLYREALAALVLSWTMLLVLGIQLTSLGLGYLFGGPKTASRRTVTVTAIVRSSAAALLIANEMYRALPFVTATVVTYGLAAIIVSTIAALVMARAGQAQSEAQSINGKVE